MIETVYVEETIADHPRTRGLLERFRHSRIVPCTHYGEIFNRHNQNFRLQKVRPALILAHKHNRRVLPVPAGHGLASDGGYYFSHMLNCLYDCRYCFLQGMFRSAHYVLFVNYEDFIDDIHGQCAKARGDTWFFSGYDCDSLALEPISGFAAHFIPALNALDNAWLELRSKSTQIRTLLDLAPAPRCICAFSLSPEPVIAAFEHRTPRLGARLAAMVRLQEHGWALGLRLDPLLFIEDFRSVYGEFFQTIFARLDPARLHSVTLGTFRLPTAYARTAARLYPEEPLFAGALAERGGELGYPAAITATLLDWCHEQVARHVAAPRIFRPAA